MKKISGYNFAILASILGLVILELVVIFTWSGNIASPAENQDIFNVGLNIIISVVGVFFTVAIFLIQNNNQDYSQSLSNTIFSNKYFLIIPILSIAIAIFNIYCWFFKFGQPYGLISLELSIGILFSVLSTLWFVRYFMNTVNVVNYETGNIIESIRTNIKKREPPKDIFEFRIPEPRVEFNNALKNKIHAIVSTCIKGIEKNEKDVVDACLDSLAEISKAYLEQTVGDIVPDDPILIYLNDQFSFITSESFRSYNQKHLETIARSMGKITLYTIMYREEIGFSHPSFLWFDSLKKLCLDSYKMERTIVGYVCIDSLNEALLLLLEKKTHYNTYGMAKGFAKSLSDSFSSVSEYHAANYLQRLLRGYFTRFLKTIQLSNDAQYDFSYEYFSEFLNDILRIIEQSKNNYSDRTLRTVVFSSFLGFPSLNFGIALTLRSIKLDSEQRKEIVYDYLRAIIVFYSKILNTSSTKSDPRIFQAYSELLFMIHQTGLSKEMKQELAHELTSSLLVCIQKQYVMSTSSSTYARDLHELERDSNDYFGVLIFLFNEDRELMEETALRLIDIYQKIKQQYSINSDDSTIRRQFYKDVKLFGSWLNLYPKLTPLVRKIIAVLKVDFYEPDMSRRLTPATIFEKYGYPIGFMSTYDKPWFLAPSQVWSNLFQDEIAGKFNSNRGINYEIFHTKLKKAASHRS